MTKIASQSAKKTEEIHLLKAADRQAGQSSVEGSLLEEFSQILDKIADHLASGHGNSETMDLLAIEQAAERVQIELSNSRPNLELRSNTAGQNENTAGKNLVEEDLPAQIPMISEEETSNFQRDQFEGAQEKGEAQLDGAPASGIESNIEQASSSGAVEVDGEEVITAPIDSPTEVSSVAPQSGDSLGIDGESASMTIQAAVIAEPPKAELGGETPAIQSRGVSAVEREGASSSATTVQTPVTALTGGATTAVEEVNSNPAVSPLSAAIVRENVDRVDPFTRSASSEKGIPFTAFMLQGQAASPGISRDAVAQSILRPTLELSHGRQVGEVAAGARGGNQGNLGGDAALLRNPANSVKSDSQAQTLKSLSRTVALRTLEKVERVMEEVARSKDGKTISLHLEPVTLGKVKVDVSLRDGNLHARLSAESAEVQQLLREHAHELQSILRKSGLHVDSVAVSVSSEQSMNEGSSDLFAQRDRSERSEGERHEAELSGQMEAPVETGKRPVVEDHWVA